MGIIVGSLIGGFPSYLAGKLMNSKTEGVIWNIILGWAAGFIGSWLFGILGFGETTSWLGSIISATVGAVLLIFVNRKLFKR
jgi:uncharacterized membrane protein YeaQ/YmgE (transglycosylase-associated protein family)